MTLLGALLLGAGPASAHDRLVSTSPEDGATVATVPETVTLTFNEAVVSVGTEVVVAGPDGQVQRGRPTIDGTTVEQGLAPQAPAGDYTVTWRATSKDGHPVSGTFSFSATAAGAGSPSATTTTSADPTTTPTSSVSTSSTTPDPIPSHRTTGGADRTGTSWAVFGVVGLVILAGLVALLVRLRSGNGTRGQG